MCQTSRSSRRPLRVKSFFAPSFLTVALCVLLLPVLPRVAEAQEAGTIRGRVVAAGSLRPLSGVQVSIPGTGRGSLTNARGEYMIVSVEPGAHTLRVQMLGYATQTRDVTVTPAQAAVAEFELEQEALALDEVVVTGTAGAARRREVGNSISQLNVENMESNPVSLDQVLQGRAAGVSVLPSSGMAGSGAQIRLRGNGSLAMSNQPLVYIDGVRVRSDGYPKNAATLIDRDIRSSNDAIGPLGDINPADIARIEVIKGAAATTLYGTEAAAGVIQIFTKKGQTGTPSWTLQSDQGVDWLQKFGTDGNPYLGLDDFMRNAHTQTYSLSVQGGRQDVRYFLSSSVVDNQGVLPNDAQEKWTVRGNVDFSPLEHLTVAWNTSFTNNFVTSTPSGNNGQGITYNAFTAPGGFVVPEDMPRLLEYDIANDITRFITGATLTHTPTDALTNRLTVGYDLSHLDARNYRPYGFISAPEGIIEASRWSGEIVTLDYTSSLRIPLPGAFATTVSVGAQGVTEQIHNNIAASRGFPGPGLATVSSGAERNSAEERQRVITAGLFGQAVVDFSDRLFLTLGTRIDGNSAFGKDFGFQVYPKASMAYVVSDEAFWPEQIGQMKLRAAYGHAGRAPGVFDAVRTWDPTGWGGLPALEPLQVGNANLGPERTKELELGFDASFLSDRLTVDFTYYNATTDNALFPVRQIPSLGFSASQLQNVGELSNRGVELATTFGLIDRPDFGADIGFRLATNRSEVLSLGGASSFSIGAEGWVVEGQPAPVLIAPHVTNGDELAEPIVDPAYVFGPNVPTHTLGFSTDLRFPRGITLAAVGEYMGGHYIKNRAFRTLAQRRVAPQCIESGYYDMLEQGQRDDITAYWRLACTPSSVDNRMFIEKADFFKLRSVSLNLPVHAFVPGSSSATFTLTGRNLFQWRNGEISLLDPEMAGNEGMNGRVREIVETIPMPASFVASLRLSF